MCIANKSKINRGIKSRVIPFSMHGLGFPNLTRSSATAEIARDADDVI